MKAWNFLRMAEGAVPARPDRPATTIVHDSPEVRVVLFRLLPQQEVPLHESPSAVLLSVLSGSGAFTHAQGERQVVAGDAAAFERGERHGMRASDEVFVVLATITPRPGARQPTRVQPTDVSASRVVPT